MIKKIITLSILCSYLLTGCGNSQKNQKSISQEPAHQGKPKDFRTKWQTINKPGESAMGVLHQSFDQGKIEIQLTDGTDVGRYIQFFIDSDHNEGTGYKSDFVDGADYLIEDGRLYHSTATGTGWNWIRVGNTQEFSRTTNTIYTSLPATDMPNIKKNFRVAAISLDHDWSIVSNILMPPIDRAIVSVDGDNSEWVNIPLFGASNIGKVKIADDPNNLYLLIYAGNIGQHTQIYIDSDQDHATGYTNGTIIGADYLIEDNRLYKATANGSGWNWTRIAYLPFAKDHNLVEIAVEKTKIGAGTNKLNIGALAWNADFNNLVSSFDMKEFTPANQKNLIISEVMASNAHTIMDPDYQEFSDWIEIHNQTANEINLGNYKLSDKLDKATWSIPEGTTIPAYGYKLFWADKKNNGMHTDFSLKDKGESIGLFNANTELIDGFTFPKQKPDISTTKTDTKFIYMTPTPEEKNSPGIDTLTLSADPIISNNGQSITIDANDGAKIYYTTDGSFPTLKSHVYNGHFDIEETTVIRARALEEGKLLSYAQTKTVFINENTTLPIISLSTDDKNLFDDYFGIYTIGRNGAQAPGCEGVQIANFYQKWARPVNIEYYDTNKNLGFSMEADMKISGSCSRVIPQKSLKFSAKSKYEKDTISYKLFPHKNIDKFDGFKLKSAGQDWYNALLRDAFMQQVIKDDLDVEYQDYQPVVVFINGKYWGIHNLREKKNEDFLAENHPTVDAKKVDLLEDNMGVNEGSNENYQELITFISNHTLSNDDNYNTVASMMDIENYIDYIIANTYFANDDWPYTNVRYWRESKHSPKWRWIIEDLDLGLGSWGDPIEQNMLELLTQVDSNNFRNPNWSTFLFRSLLENSNFKSRFKQKYTNYLNSTFQTNRVISILDSITAKIRPEIARHTIRWKDSSQNMFQNTDNWESNINNLKTIIQGRNATVRNELANF